MKKPAEYKCRCKQCEFWNSRDGQHGRCERLNAMRFAMENACKEFTYNDYYEQGHA